MPVYPCRHPTCTEYVTRGGEYCEQHRHEAQPKRAEQQRHYDRFSRDPEAKAFYNSAAWKRARAIKLANYPWCERCNRAPAKHVHHRVPLSKCTPAQKLDQENLKSLCPPCHREEEKESIQCSTTQPSSP